MNFARGRPQPRSGAAAHDQWNNSSVHRRLKSCMVAIPGDKITKPVLDSGLRPETGIAHQFLDIGKGLRHVAGLHRQHLLDRRAAQFPLQHCTTWVSSSGRLLPTL